MYDTIIIGAGMSGLAAGIRLANFGLRVCIVERHYTIGGLNSFYRLRGRNYDVGLHAVTNFTPKGAKKGPLARLLRQLRIRWEEFDLAPQLGSRIVFPGVSLSFNNDVELLEAEIAENFPRQIDNFRKLQEALIDYDDLDDRAYSMSAREVLSEIIDDPLLCEMLLCPLMWYGNAREHDMDFAQFSIMFRSIYLEGFARPLAGVRLILKTLVKKYRGLGGELRLRAGVKRIDTENEAVAGVTLENGEQLTARTVLSSAGLVETERLCSEEDSPKSMAGQLSFAEMISVLDREPKSLGFDNTIVFFNDSEKFEWARPENALCDVRTGVICSPNNFKYRDNQTIDDNMIRITALANYDLWAELPEEQYQTEKHRWYDRMIASAVRFVPDFRSRVIDVDTFTPTTIRRFTFHENGAVYGAPNKRVSGETDVRNLFLCGTDQGWLGIVGAIVSGICIANRNVLPIVSSSLP